MPKPHHRRPPQALERKERVTWHIRFRRDWIKRLIVQVEVVVHWHDPLSVDQGAVETSIEWRDATKQELEEIERGYFEPESHHFGARNKKGTPDPTP